MSYVLRFLLCVFIVLSIYANSEEQSGKDSSNSSSQSAVQSKVRLEVVDALIEQVINDPLVHLKYWHWGGHSTSDLDKYILKKYENTNWKVTPEEAKVLKSRAIDILDNIYSKKAKEKFNSPKTGE